MVHSLRPASLAKAIRDQIASALRRLAEEGGDYNFVVFTAAGTGGSADYHVQFASSCRAKSNGRVSRVGKPPRHA